MAKITIKQPNPEGFAPGSTATFRIPVGRRIHALFLQFNAAKLSMAQITEVRIYLNSQIFQRFTGTQRNVLNMFDGLANANTTGILHIPFDRSGLYTLAGMEESAINTAVADEAGRKISSMYMEMDIAAASTITGAEVALYSKESDPVPGGPGTIPYIRTEGRSAAGADTDFQISDLVNPGVNAPDKLVLVRAMFTPSAGVISNLKIDRNTYTVYDRTDSLNRLIQQNGMRFPQAGYYMIDTQENGVAGDVIELYGMTDFRYRLALSQAMNISILSEYYGILPAG